MRIDFARDAFFDNTGLHTALLMPRIAPESRRGPGLRGVGMSVEDRIALMTARKNADPACQWMKVVDTDLEAKIQSLTLEQVNAAFRKHIDASQVSIVKAGDFAAAGAYK